MTQDIDQEKLEHALERVEAMEALAERILAECRVQLMMSFRFLDRALWKMPFRSIRMRDASLDVKLATRSPLATDGHVLYYNARSVIGAFRRNPDVVVRTYLHSLLHCIFRHPFRTVRADMSMWALACDICVETIALEMCNGRYSLNGDEIIERLEPRIVELCGGMTPAKVYRMLLLTRKEEASGAQMQLLAELEGYNDLYGRDDHQLWDLLSPPDEGEEPQNPGGGAGGDESADGQDSAPDNPDEADTEDVEGDEGQDSDADPDEGAEPDDRDGQDGEGDDEAGQSESPQEQQQQPPGDAPAPPQQELTEQATAEPEYSEAEPLEPMSPDDGDEDDWEQIAKQVETELRTMEKERGEGAGTFMDNLALANRSRVNYEDFLRRFATRAEDAKLNDEEFDYIFYTYGLKLYENMPLVEPLEYMETERIREFAIAIDTSGSCSRGLTQAFLTRTYEILSRGQGFDERVNVHIIQCDADIQSDVVVHDLSELSDYERGFEVRGYGGTDFRPVFAYIDELIAKKEFTDLRGLVYFTDGYGTFPSVAPDYDVAFVFVEEDGKERRVPPWAMKVVLDEDTLYEMEAIG